MKAIQSVGMTVCYTCIAISVLSVLMPKKRTRRIMSFVIGLFFIVSLITALRIQIDAVDLRIPEQSFEIPMYSEKDLQDEVAKETVNNLTNAVRDILSNEGITPEDVQLTIKISDNNRIYVARAVIYINEKDKEKIAKVKSIVYRNLSKEPEVYVKGKKAQPAAE